MQQDVLQPMESHNAASDGVSDAMFDVICVGSATVDVFAKTEAELIKIEKMDSEEELIAYPLGSKILITHIDFQTGGGGTNTAVAFSRLGFRTGYLGNIGNDPNSKAILSMLDIEHIKFLGVQKGMAGYSVILDSVEEDRTILTYKGANDCLLFKDIADKAKLLKTRWFYCSSLIGESFKTLCGIAEYARKNRIALAFNPSSYQAKMGIKKLKPILRAATVLVLNREEAGILTEMKTGSVPELMKAIHNLGMPYVSITDGKRGSYVSDAKQILFSAPCKVNVVETTGAGDAFASGFIAGLIKGKALDACLRMGMIEAESVIAYQGAKNKLLNAAEMEKALKKDRHIIEKIA